MSFRRIPAAFLVLLLVAGTPAEGIEWITNPTADEDCDTSATIGTEGETPYTSGNVTVKLVKGNQTEDSQVVAVDTETGAWSHTFDPPAGGWETGDYLCELHRSDAQVAFNAFTVTQTQ